MKLRYDSKVDAMYIELAKGAYKRTEKISDDILVDKDNKGHVIGIEILDAKKNIAAFDPANISLLVQTS